MSAHEHVFRDSTHALNLTTGERFRQIVSWYNDFTFLGTSPTTVQEISCIAKSPIPCKVTNVAQESVTSP